MIRNKQKEDQAANKARNKARKEREKAERKRKKAEDKAAKSAEKAEARRLKKRAADASLRSLSNPSTPNDGLETNTHSVSNPSDGKNNHTPAPPTTTLRQNEGMLNNLTPAPPTNTLLQDEGVPNNLTPAPPTITLLQNEGMSNNESEPLTFEQTLKNIKLGIKPTTPLHSHPQTIDLQKKFNEKLFKHKVNHCHYCKERWYDAKGTVDIENNFECHVCERTRKMEDVKVRLMSKENTMDPDPESTKIMLLLPKLTDIEEMFIARVHVVVKVYRLSKGAM